ncbi:MAG: ribonucleoside-diphosphate reductase subunit alpha [Myxococcales bacterium]|nr:ribonucleoside-diphosphate reductase subunit alpha [Myxococcales bacterium]
MRVKKRNGTLEPVDVNKIVKAVHRCSDGLAHVDANRVAIRTISGLYDGAITNELDQLSIQTAASLIAEEPQYSKLAGRLLSLFIDKEVRGQEIQSFSQSIAKGLDVGVISDELAETVAKNKRKINHAIDQTKDRHFEYFGLRTIYDRYLLKDPESRNVIETPQYFFMRVALVLSRNISEAVELYELFAGLTYLPSSPTLFNSGTRHQQLSSCFLLDSPQDDLRDIYSRYADVAQLSKFSGGVGMAYHRVRSQGSLIRSTNGHSNGIIPWLNTLDASVAAVNQGGKRKGACCVYLESWHADIEAFLECRENTGDEARRTYNLNLANWVSDLFMKRVESDSMWSLFDPKDVPDFCDLWGEKFEAAYLKAEASGLYLKQVRARDLYARMMRSLAQTGNGWMTFKDASNSKCNQTLNPEYAVHLSNLCTEIIEVTSGEECAVCNLGSVNLGRHTTEEGVDYAALRKTVKLAMRALDRVIDLNFYPIEIAKNSNLKWRPVGLGLMGLQDVFFKMGLQFDSEEAKAISTRISEEIYFAALETSCELAETYGAHPNFAETRAAQGQLQFDLWGIEPQESARWVELKNRIAEHGLRNSLMIAIAPTATIASIAGCYECIEPQVSNLFKRETLSGEFLQINNYLVQDLKSRGLWTNEIRNRIKLNEGSIQDIEEIPQDIRDIYRTVWELPMRALIDMAADRGAYIDQSQSLNLFSESPDISKLSSMYFYAWKKGLKTTYYLRSRPATRIAKATIETSGMSESQKQRAEALACSLENPESCESCQ